jgi:cobalamin synthase
VPDLIKGIICTTKGINPYVYHDAFNVGNMAQASSTVCIFVYICVICAILAISVKHNKFRLKIYEDIIFAFVLVFLTFIFIYHYYSLVSNVVEGFTTGDSGMALGGILELGFIIFAVCFSII